LKNFKILILISGLLLLAETVSFQQSNDKNLLIRKKDEVEKEIELANQLLSETKEKRTNSLHEVKLLNNKIKSRSKLIEDLNFEILLIEKEIQDQTVQLNILRSELEKCRKQYADMIYYAFKNENMNINFMYLLASKDISQFYSRYAYLNQYKAHRLSQIVRIEDLQEEIEEELITLNVTKQERINRINEQLTEKAILQKDKGEINLSITKLKQQEEDLLKQLEEKRRQHRKLNEEIELLIKKEANKSQYEKLTPEEKLISNEFVLNRGRLPWPLEKGIIIDHYGEHNHPVIKDLIIRNNGIDIATVAKSKARAVFNGEVSKVFTIKGANTTVILRHGNFYTVYHNLVNVTVKVGDQVKAKEFLGEIYYDEKAGKTIIHFEVWKEMEKQNPEEWLSN